MELRNQSEKEKKNKKDNKGGGKGGEKGGTFFLATSPTERKEGTNSQENC